MRNVIPIIKKELREMSRDTTLPVLTAIMILITVIIFISGAEMERIPTVIIRNEYSGYSNSLVDSIKSDKFFWVQQETSDKTYSYQLLKTRKAILIIDIPSTLSSDISEGSGEITLIYEAQDGRVAQTAVLHLQGILGNLNQGMLNVRLLNTEEILSQGVDEIEQIPYSFSQIEDSLTETQEGLLRLQSELSGGGEIEGFGEELEEIENKLSQSHRLLVDVGIKINNVYVQLNDPDLVAIIPILPPDVQQTYAWAVGNTSDAMVETATADKFVVDSARKMNSLSISVEGGEIDFTKLTQLNNELSSINNQLILLSNKVSSLRDVFTQTNDNLQKIGSVGLSVEEVNSELGIKDMAFATSAPLMVWMLSIMVSLRSLSNERVHGTFKRLITAPMSLWELVAGKFIALSIVLSIAPPISMILLGIYILGLESIGSILVLTLIYILTSMNGVGVGILISSITSSERRALELVALVVGGSLPLIGWIVPSFTMPSFAQALKHLTPISYFTEASKAIMLRGDVDVWRYLLVPFIFTIIYFILSELFLEREVKSA